MKSTLATLALLSATALAGNPGKAVVINQCKYDVHLCDVPAQGGGHEETDKVLSSGETWSKTWTQLTNGAGWSIKLSKTAVLSSIMQYEYTYHNDGTIWYDLSDVDGNPWDGNWEITADSSSCTPKQQAYRYATDDAYGMQSCSDDSTITVTLCSGEEQNDDAASAALSSVVAEFTVPASLSFPTPAAEESSEDATTTAHAAATSHHFNHQYQAAQADEDSEPSTTAVVTPTTFATKTTVLHEMGPGMTVWEVETAVVTEVVTAIYTAPSRIKRHEHHAVHHNA